MTGEALASLAAGDVDHAVALAADSAIPLHYRFWGAPGPDLGFSNVRASFARLGNNPSVLSDLREILDWREDESRTLELIPELRFPCRLELHARYSNNELKAHLGAASFESGGVTGVGLIHCVREKAYALLLLILGQQTW